MERDESLERFMSQFEENYVYAKEDLFERIEGKTLKDFLLDGVIIVLNEEGHLVVHINGGENGGGDWQTYFDLLKQQFKLYSNEYNDVYLISINVDVIDDVFDAYIGISSK